MMMCVATCSCVVIHVDVCWCDGADGGDCGDDDADEGVGVGVCDDDYDVDADAEVDGAVDVDVVVDVGAYVGGLHAKPIPSIWNTYDAVELWYT